jgi:AcrR family transcriptional regulator
MGRVRSTNHSRLSVDDWIQADFAILAAEGIKALKIDRLCRHLAVTKGSFYWHFTDIAAYRAALVQAWGELRDEERRHFGELTALPPRERLLQMMSSLVSPQHWTLERAMREWARTDDAAAASVRAADQRVLAAVRQAYLDYGFDGEDAEVRANATFAAGVGFLHIAGAQPGPRATAGRERFTELIVPARYGGRLAAFPAILDPVRRMAHGCASSAWTIGFYALHNWMLALFDELAQEGAFATHPFLAPAPLAPTGRGVPTGGGVRLTGRWSWATG